MMRILKPINIFITIFLALIAMVPFYSLLVTAFSSPKWTSVLAPEFVLENFGPAWTKSELGLAIVNSAIITVFSIVLIILFSASAGYAFARMKNKFHTVFYYAFLFSMMIPGIINIVPLYSLMRSINGVNSYWGMVALLTNGALPFATFLYTSFIQTMSLEIEESAYMDGCTKLMTFFKIVFPLLKPVTSTVIILNAVSIWNNYGTAVFFLQKQSMRTVPLAISSFVQTYGADYNQMAAATLIGMLPAVIIFLSFQKSFIKGIAAGSVKG